MIRVKQHQQIKRDDHHPLYYDDLCALRYISLIKIDQGPLQNSLSTC